MADFVCNVAMFRNAGFIFEIFNAFFDQQRLKCCDLFLTKDSDFISLVNFHSSQSADPSKDTR